MKGKKDHHQAFSQSMQEEDSIIQQMEQHCKKNPQFWRVAELPKNMTPQQPCLSSSKLVRDTAFSASLPPCHS
jgi:hypothetical protein